jgi:hypothetical protein
LGRGEGGGKVGEVEGGLVGSGIVVGAASLLLLDLSGSVGAEEKKKR